MNAAPRLAFLLLSAGLSAQIPQPQLVLDLNRTSSLHSQSSYPSGMTAEHDGFWRHSRYAVVGAHVFLRADEMDTGTELYCATATPGSARLVQDINPGMNDSAPDNFLVIGNKLYFTADDGTNGFQIWEAMVDAGGATVRRLTSLSGTASDTAIGPMIAGKVGNVDTIYFTKLDAMAASFLIHAVALPTGSVTTVPAPLDQHWSQPTRIGSHIVFEGTDFRGTEAWWMDDNHNAGVLMDDPTANGMCQYPVVIGNKVYFAARSGTWGLYSWDGQNPVQHVAALPGPWSTPVLLGTKIVFDWGGLPHAIDTAAQTPSANPLPNELAGNTFKTAIYFPVVMGNKAYYYGYSMIQPVAAYYLFETDGVTAQAIPGTRNDTFGSWWSYPEVVDDAAIYFNFKSSGAGWSLHRFDGSMFTRIQIHRSTTSSANPSYMTGIDGKVVFQAEDGRFGNELWISDGTQAGTMLHTNIAEQMRTDSSNPHHFTPLGRRMMFSANDGLHGFEPWITDGDLLDLSGFSLFDDIEVGPASSDPKGFASDERQGALVWIDGELYPRLTLNLSGWDPLDGPMVTEDEWDKRFTTALGEILIHAYDPAVGKEPHVVNPKTKKLELLADTNPGPGDGKIASPVNVGKKTVGVKELGNMLSGTLVFVAEDTVSEVSVPMDFEPNGNLVALDDLAEKIAYKGFDSLGFPFAAIYDLKQHSFGKFRIAPGLYDNVFEQPFNIKLGAAFWASEGMESFLFWSDGTTGNTKKLSMTPIFGLDRFHNTLTQKEEVAVDLGQTDWKICFPYTNNNTQVWKTDGNTAERVGSLDLYDVTDAISLGGSRVAFIGNTDATGFEVFVTDGMAIHNISDVLAPGPADGVQWGAGLWAMKGKLFFNGYQALGSGSELYSWDAGALAQPYGTGTDPQIRFRAADPKIGGMAEFNITGAPINNNLAIAVFGAPAATSFLVAGERVYLDLFSAQALAILMNQGSGNLQFQIPMDPSLIGIHLVVQAAILPYLNALNMALTYPQMLTVGM